MTASTITLPAELRPRDGRFGSGPSKVNQAAVDALADAAPLLLGTSHRQAPVKDLVRRLREGLRTYFRLPDDYTVALGNGGATLFWDAAGHCLIRQRSAHAVFGEFSSKFADAVAAMPFLDEPVRREAEFGDRPSLEGISDVDTYALTHCETSTGVAMPVQRPGDGLVLVDATSAAGGEWVDPTAFDAYYFSPQKGFASDGGLWVALLSPAALARLDEVAASRYVPTMLDLRTAVDNSAKDQTYNTPAIATLYLMVAQLDWLNARGLRTIADACAAKATLLYDWAASVDYAQPFIGDAAKRSSVVCTIDLDPSVSADDVCAALRANRIVDTDAYRKLGRNQLRVAVYPAVDHGDVVRLTDAIDYVVSQLRGS